MAPGAIRSLTLLVCAEMAAMSLWFVSAAILPEITAEAQLAPARAAALSTAVQLGFVLGALAIAVHGTADRFDPRRVMAASALLGALANGALLLTPPGGLVQVALRALTGAALAGVYPVGMKIAVGWSLKRRGLLVGVLVCALTLGSASPHALALAGGASWRFTVAAASGLALLAAGLALLTRLGPHHARAPRFDPAALALIWRNRRLRLAYAGYLCHMWELYALWAWMATALTLSFTPRLGAEAAQAARVLTLGAISIGGLLCIPAGALADRWGKARVAGICLAGSATAAFVTAGGFGGAPWLTAVAVLIWGALVIPDSALYSALVADAAPPQSAGSLMALQSALGFALTALTVQGAPLVAAGLGWPLTLALMGVGPVLGVEAMRRLARLSGL